jgi:hypothetical protein
MSKVGLSVDDLQSCARRRFARGAAVRDSQGGSAKNSHTAWQVQNYTVSFISHENAVPTIEARTKGVNDAIGCHVCGVNGHVRAEKFEGNKPIRDDTLR